MPSQGISPPWSEQDIDLLRGHLRQGLTLTDTAKALGRSPQDVETKTAELFRPGQKIRGVSGSSVA